MERAGHASALVIVGLMISPALITFVPEWTWLPTALLMGPVWLWATRDRTIDRGIKQAERFANTSTHER